MKPTHPILSRISAISRLQKENLLACSYNITLRNCEGFLREAEHTLLLRVEDPLLRKRLFAILVECLININLPPHPLKLSFLAAGFAKNNRLFVLSGNIIPIEQKMFLRNKIDEINSMDKPHMKFYIKELLLNSELAKLKENGFYLLDIAHKARSKLSYSFVSVDKKSMYFYLKITI